MFRTAPSHSPSAATEPPGDGTASLTRRLVQGEERAWRELHDQYAPRLWRYLLVAARGNEEAASEALQRTFIRAARYTRRWKTEAELWGWLTLLARQTLSDSRRTETRWQRFLHRFHGEQSTQSTGIAHPPDHADHDLMPIVLQAAWAQLDPADRTLLENKYYHHASVRDLAEGLGVPEKTMESRLTRARSRLRTRILRLIKK